MLSAVTLRLLGVPFEFKLLHMIPSLCLLRTALYFQFLHGCNLIDTQVDWPV